MERLIRFELTSSGWKPGILPLDDSRMAGAERFELPLHGFGDRPTSRCLMPLCGSGQWWDLTTRIILPVRAPRRARAC